MIYIGYVAVSLLGDFLGAYCDIFLSFIRILKSICKAIIRILTDIKFWLVFSIACLLFIIPFAAVLSFHEELEASKIDVQIILSDGRVFNVKKSEIEFGEDSIEFVSKGETIKTTLFTISYKNAQKTLDKVGEQ